MCSRQAHREKYPAEGARRRTLCGKVPGRHTACRGRMLFWVRFFPAGLPQQIVDADVVEVRQYAKHLRWDIPLAGLIIGVASLGAMKQPRDILLLEVVILPQIPNAFIHGLHPLPNQVYTKQNVILIYTTNCYILSEG